MLQNGAARANVNKVHFSFFLSNNFSELEKHQHENTITKL